MLISKIDSFSLMLSIQWAWFWWLERGIFISILAEAYRPKANGWFSWHLLSDDSWVIHFPLARFFFTLNMRNQTMLGFYAEKKASIHYVYMKIKLFYAILVHSWCELSKATIRHILVLFPVSHFPSWQCFYWNKFSGLSVEFYFLVSPFFIIWALLVKSLTLNLNQLIFYHKLFMASFYWMWLLRLNF